MTEEVKALALMEEVKAIDAWGDQEQIKALGIRLKDTIPGWSKLKPEHAVAAAQYAVMTGSNPIRGEIYAYTDWQGNLQIVDGYKMLVRWARRQSNFYDKYVELTKKEREEENIPEGSFAERCFILREDARGMMKDLQNMGVSFKEAYEIVAISAIGVVTPRDMFVQGGKNKGKPINPAKGWTWKEVAKKRALKNALNRAYGMPSPQEISQESWMVDDVKTVSADWADVRPGASSSEMTEMAKINARDRELTESQKPTSPEEAKAALDRGRRILHGDETVDEFIDGEMVDSEPVEPEPKSEEKQAESVLDELALILTKLGSDATIEDGKDRYLVQQAFSELGLKAPKWSDNPTVKQISEQIKEAMGKDEGDEQA